MHLEQYWLVWLILLKLHRNKDILLAILISSYFKMFLIVMMVWFSNVTWPSIVCEWHILWFLLPSLASLYWFINPNIPLTLIKPSTGLGVSIFCDFHHWSICFIIQHSGSKRYLVVTVLRRWQNNHYFSLLIILYAPLLIVISCLIVLMVDGLLAEFLFSSLLISDYFSWEYKVLCLL